MFKLVDQLNGQVRSLWSKASRRSPEFLLKSGDEIYVVVNSAKPFGLFVESDAGLSGLVRSVAAGATLRLRVVEFNAAESRSAR